MPAQHGQLPQFKIGKVFPSAIKLPGNAGVEYLTTPGGLVIPRGPNVSFGLQSNAALPINGDLPLATGVASTVTIINKIFVRASVTGIYGLFSNAVQIIELYISTGILQVIDFGDDGTVQFCVFAGDVLNLRNLTAGVVNLKATAFGNQYPYQT